MAAASRDGSRSGQSARGFTLVEILVTVALLSFIVLGLFAVFNQVQRAFKSSMNQVDQLEAGRAVTELVPRELEQTFPSGAPFPTGVNFYAQMLNSAPLTQALPGTANLRTNVLQDCYMLLRSNQTWIGIGYCVRRSDTNQCLWLPECKAGQLAVGTLYRYSASMAVLHSGPIGDKNNGLPQDPGTLFTGFIAAAQPGLTNLLFSRICDGVIQFQFRAFDPLGVPIIASSPAADIRFSTLAPGEIGRYWFCSNAVPAAVEMELGILEQRALDRYNSVGNGDAGLAYLQRAENTSRVHLFRQRIPLRNVDPLAYP